MWSSDDHSKMTQTESAVYCSIWFRSLVAFTAFTCVFQALRENACLWIRLLCIPGHAPITDINPGFLHHVWHHEIGICVCDWWEQTSPLCRSIRSDISNHRTITSSVRWLRTAQSAQMGLWISHDGNEKGIGKVICDGWLWEKKGTSTICLFDLATSSERGSANEIKSVCFYIHTTSFQFS